MQSPLETPVQELRDTRLVEEVCAMDRIKHSISPHDLYAQLGSDAAPGVIDVRRPADLARIDKLVAPAQCVPDQIELWREDLPGSSSVVVYCGDGEQVSQGVAIALRAMGVEANFLEGGIAGWIEQGMPTPPSLPNCPHPNSMRRSG